MGHGHVIPNENGSRARCGGPGLCEECSLEQAAVSVAGRRFTGEQPDLDTAIAIGEKWGYGNVIQALRNAWSKKLQTEWKMDKDGADSGAGFICAWCRVDERTGKKAKLSRSEPQLTKKGGGE